MNRFHWLGLVVLSIVSATALLGCQQRPAVPTVAVEPTQPVVVIVITATSQPTLAPTNIVEATITAIPTLTPVEVTATPAVQATATSQATRPPATSACRSPQTRRQKALRLQLRCLRILVHRLPFRRKALHFGMDRIRLISNSLRSDRSRLTSAI